MSSIDVNHTILKDDRLIRLAIAVGSREMALGCLIYAWDLAYDSYDTPTGYIPEEKWRRLKHNEELVSCGLAEHRDGGVYVRGTKKWINKRRSNKNLRQISGRMGGLKSQENRRSKIKPETSTINLPSPSPSPSPYFKKKYIYTGHEKLNETKTTARSELDPLIFEWQTTLSKYSISRDARSDEITLARLAQIHPIADVASALRGFRFEKPSKDYDPSQHISLHRLFKPSAFDRLRNLGATMVQTTSKLVSEKDAIP